MDERFTDRAQKVVALAGEEAKRLGQGYVDTEHILLGLIREREGVAAKALESLGVDLDKVREQTERAASRSHPPPLTAAAQKALDLAVQEAERLGRNYVGTEHVLLGLLREGHGVVPPILGQYRVHLSQARQRIQQLLQEYQNGKQQAD